MILYTMTYQSDEICVHYLNIYPPKLWTLGTLTLFLQEPFYYKVEKKERNYEKYPRYFSMVLKKRIYYLFCF